MQGHLGGSVDQASDLISAQVLISVSWVQALCWSPGLCAEHEAYLKKKCRGKEGKPGSAGEWGSSEVLPPLLDTQKGKCSKGSPVKEL